MTYLKRPRPKEHTPDMRLYRVTVGAPAKQTTAPGPPPRARSCGPPAGAVAVRRMVRRRLSGRSRRAIDRGRRRGAELPMRLPPFFL